MTVRQLSLRKRKTDEREARELYRDARRQMPDYWRGRSYDEHRRTPQGIAIRAADVWFYRDRVDNLAALRRSDGRHGYVDTDGRLHWTGYRLVTTIPMCMN